ncbi:MAG: DUF6778 family protein [Pseudomonadota bacterium]
MKKSVIAVGIATSLALSGCVEGLLPTSEPGAAAPAAVADPPLPTDPRALYRIEKVVPLIARDASLNWFRPDEGSPRDVGAFVGQAVIRGIDGRFNGLKPAELEVSIHQFSPVIVGPTTPDGAVHRVKVDLIMRDPATGSELGRSDGIFMDLIALTGTAAAIARNAGRTPEARLEERIARITSSWADELTCNQALCPRPNAPPLPPLAAAPAPKQVPQASAVPQPVARPGADPVEPAPVAVAPVETPAAPPASENIAAVEPETVLEPGAPEEEGSFFSRLFGSDDAEEATEPASDAIVATEDPEPPAPVVAAEEPEVEIAAAPAEAGEEEGAGATIEGFFGSLFGSSDGGEDATVAAAEPAEEAEAPAAPVVAASPAPASAAPVLEAPTPAAAEPSPPVSPAPVVAEAAEAPQPAPPAPAAAPAPQPAPTVAQSQPEAASIGQQSPFFRSPAAAVPTLPQTALLGRAQRAADPLRRNPGDVVLEISNIPAFWNGDETSGGIWVALPYVPAYRQAIVTNPVNGRTVEANLFWRDPQAGGGSTLLSSAAAQALGVAPGQVSNLGVKVVAGN